MLLFLISRGGESLKNNKDILKGIGVALSIVGFVVSVASNWVNDQELDIKIDERINEILAEREEEEEDDERTD